MKTHSGAGRVTALVAAVAQAPRSFIAALPTPPDAAAAEPPQVGGRDSPTVVDF